MVWLSTAHGLLPTQKGVIDMSEMTEQEKNEIKFIIVSALVILIVAITSGLIWRWTPPMKPIIVEQGDRTTVRWGSRLYPFEYVAVGEFSGLFNGAETETVSIPRIGLFRIEDGHLLQAIQTDGHGWRSINELPSEAYRRHFEGRVILEEYLNRQKSTALRAVDGPAITER